MTEHYLKPYGGYSPSPLMFLAAAAAQTKSIRLMTGGIQASFHHPIQLAAEAAQLDAISNGRLELASRARSCRTNSRRSASTSIRARRASSRRSTRRCACSPRNRSARTRRSSATATRNRCRARRSSRGRRFVAALLTPSSFEWIGERGFNLLMAAPPRKDALAKTQDMVALYRETFERHHGHTGRRPQVAISIPLMIGTSDAHALALAEPRLRHHWRYFADAAKSWEQVQSSAYQATTKR